MLSPRIRVLDGPLDAVLAKAPRTEVLAVPVASGPTVDARTRAVLAALGVDLDAVLRLEKVEGRAGSVTRVPWTPPGEDGPGVDRVLLVGTGVGTPADLRTAGAALARAVAGRDRVVTTVGAGTGAPRVRALVEGVTLASYRTPRTGVTTAPPAPARRLDLVGRYDAAAVTRAGITAGATVRARDLANTPSSTKGPAWMAARAKAVAAQYGLGVRVWEPADLAKDGFGGILAVGSGAGRGPRLVRLDHVPAGARPGAPHVVLVGKGITFDSGGLSLKPRESMVPMKTDMAGAGAVLAALAGCAELGVPVRVTGLLPLAENAIGARSYRPGDVITSYSGTTIEVRNTDAEGRLVLADALAYADAELDPDLLVDVATLTGAATQSLGRTHAALFATDERLAAALTKAGEETGERLWRMPLVEDYRAMLDSEIADVCHIPTVASPGAGAVTAALFLRDFVGGRRWAHLDIAGPGRSEKDSGTLTKGGTGFGARLLLRWLEGLR